MAPWTKIQQQQQHQAVLTRLTFEVKLNPHHVIILSNQVPDNIINAGHVGLLKKKGKLVNKISHGKEEKKVDQLICRLFYKVFHQILLQTLSRLSIHISKYLEDF